MSANLAAVVLAAGASSRMGRTKALLPAGGTVDPALAPGQGTEPAPVTEATFLGRLLDTLEAAAVPRTVVVASAAIEEAVRAIVAARAAVVVNPTPERGQLSSLVVGLDALEGGHPGGESARIEGSGGAAGAFGTGRAPAARPPAGQEGGAARVSESATLEAILSVPVDVPLVAPATVRALIEAWMQRRAPVVRPARGSRHGHPVIFDRAVFDELRRAVGEPDGARAVIRRHRARILDVAVADEGAFIDVDTPEDYRRLFGREPPPP
ncbi:MAG TPA: nucleotidyltransferase family protein [Vicinamibacterales bacterium]|nr:nucleotidyltransferase family protein [Vicinamibacterales bacterium]